jgi:hypothetical protein
VTVTDHRDLVTALLAVEGVAEAAVERGDDDEDLGSLRLLLQPGADEVAVAAAVNDLLRARFGLAVDTDRVRVLEEPASALETDEQAGAPAAPASTLETDEHAGAPAGSAGPAASAASAVGPSSATALRTPHLPQVHMARPGRLTIRRIQMLTAGLGVVATVQLALEGAEFEGTAEGAATVTSVHRSVATATLRAVESVVDGRARFEVEHLEVAISGRDRTALVVITMLTGRANERLSGASVVREDVRQAVVRAVLAAVNRRLEPMLDEK